MKKLFLILTFFILLTGSFFYFFKFQGEKSIEKPKPNFVKNSSLIIILSPHFDDAVLSLGGLMAKRESPLLVATFFTKRPTEIIHTEWDKISGFSDSDEAIFTRTKENENALLPFGAIIKNYDYLDFQYRKNNKKEQQNKKITESIARDIQSIIADNKDKELFIYGPATFGPKITHPDHQIVHDAFMDVIKSSYLQKINFFIYEDFPYIRQFNISNQESLNNYLEKTNTLKLEETPIKLSETELKEKISSINKYASQVKAFSSFGDDVGAAKEFYKTRCKTPASYACEVVNTVTSAQK